MNLFHKFAAITVAALNFASFDASAAIDNQADVVLLRKSCADGAGGTLNNCFTAGGNLHTWIWNTRNPSLLSPLLVDAGPGTFGAISCPNGRGYVSYRGAGRGKTIFSGGTTTSFTFGASITNCKMLAFEHLTITGTFIGVFWTGGGSSTWNDVHLLGGYSAWYDSIDSSGSACPNGQQGTHNFSSSTLEVKPTATSISGGIVFLNSCGKNWLRGSEIVLDATTTTANTGTFPGILSQGAGNEMHLYGSNLRLVSGNASTLSGLSAIGVSDNAQVHVHGTGIDVIAVKPISIVAIGAGTGGEVHADQSAYVLKTGVGGSVTRILNNGGHVHAPYLWQHVPDTDGNLSTVDTNFTSVNGADQTTVTVGTSDGHPHTAVYSSSCPFNARWYDQVDKVCRGQ